MISNERPSPYGAASPAAAGANPSHKEETIQTTRLQIERKTFVFALKQNPRGRFLRITEGVGDRRDTIIIPAPGLEEFRNLMDDMIRKAEQTSSQKLESED